MPQSEHPTSQKIILVGEDDPDDQEFLKDIFASVDPGFLLIFLHNGALVIDYLERCESDSLPCLILLDYNMPEMDGSDILKKLSGEARYQNIPKIIWSTSSSPTYRNKCLELGATEYLVKPSSIQALTDIAGQMIGFANRQAG